MERLRGFSDQAAFLMDNRIPPPPSDASPGDQFIHKDRVRRVIHEVNNQLGIVKNYLGTLDGEDNSARSSHLELGLVQAEIDRVGQLITSLGQEAGSSTPGSTFEPVDLNRIITDLDRILGPSVFRPAKVNFKYRLAADLPSVQGEYNALIQVFLNLFKNAVEAMPRGGNLRVHTACRRTSENQGQRQIIITVSDTGPGLASTVPKQFFRSGVTTKNISNSGLGLAIVKDIIKQHRGAVFFQTQRGKGATVVILLPIEDTNKHNAPGSMDGGLPRDLSRKKYASKCT
jgi:signal transduction histidine kinase